MKIYIGKYKDNWISPYTVKEKFFFWKKDYDAFENKPPVLLTKACEGWLKIANFFNRKINYVKIDKWDTWSMDSTLSPIILPMLKQLKTTKHGCPWTKHEDGPWYYRFQTDVDEHHYTEEGSFNHERWNWIMDEMIWAFEQLSKDNYDEQYWRDYGELDWDCAERDENGLIPIKWKSDSVVDWDGIKKHEDAIKNGLILFGKYYQSLWD